MQDIYKSYLIHQATDGQWRNEWVDQPEGHSSHLNALGKLDVNHSLRGKRKNHDVVERPCDMPRQFQFREHYYQEKPLQLCKWQYFNYISYIVGLWYQMAAPWILKICCSFTRCLKKLTHMCELWLWWYWNWHRCLPIKYGHITRGYGYGVQPYICCIYRNWLILVYWFLSRWFCPVFIQMVVSAIDLGKFYPDARSSILKITIYLFFSL